VMKKLFILAAAALMFTACSKDSEVVPSQEKNDNTAIGFQVLNKNMSRATAKMEEKGHYNFGVWAYKNTDATNEIMANYLVGFFGDDTNPVGYSKTGTTNSTWGGTNDGTLTNAKSWWGYEGLGYTQYHWDTNTGTQKYYKDTEDFYKSNVDVQYLRYWDLSSANTEFFAYAPYINGSTTATFDNSTKIMELPEGSIVAGYDDESKYEYLYAYSNVGISDYKKDVALNFLHLNSKIRIAFWEDIAGYSVKMENLTSIAPILAVPATVSSSVYSYSEELVKTAKTTIKFSSTPAVLATPTTSTTYTLGSTGTAIDASINDKALVFKAPVATELATTKSAISDDDYSETIYYGIPHDSSCGLTFRVSFTLTSTTGEKIKVQNAAVHVEAANCVWAPGYQYTYVFRITKDATGTTGNPGTITVDPSVPEKALYPIVFDGITVEDWKNATDIDKDIN
ncbi:MAG: fimbrillin family protein, partial [Bacteroidales bacterium]|nr:fimbrillin family protein [Bacteroidales bacterium]